MSTGLARGSDPDTSHAAAGSVDATEMEARVLAAIRKFPEGCIGDQIERELPSLRIWSISPRIKPLIKKGLVVDTGQRRPGASGRGQRVVIASEFFKEIK